MISILLNLLMLVLWYLVDITHGVTVNVCSVGRLSNCQLEQHGSGISFRPLNNIFTFTALL